jgi:EAL domain-containing protein (putative c-di-GMP-specific phosphodiesterase class I)
VVALGDVVLNQAAHDARLIAQAAGGSVNVSVNISAKQLREPDFVTKVERAVSTMGDAGLVLEITERDGIGDDEASLRAMRTLADRGVPFAVDDFGVGFSSIGYLQHLPVDILKIDRSFTRDVDSNPRAAALVEAILVMGAALDLRVVAEGIERPGQAARLREAGCTIGQGFLFGRPVPLEEAAGLLRAGPEAARRAALSATSA